MERISAWLFKEKKEIISETRAALNERMRKSYSSWPERLGEAAGWGRELMTWKWEQGLAAAVKRREGLLCSLKGSLEPR